ncbi:MAG: hypothetical protein M3M93_02970 [Actinomycetota bacterium]|nr:hypothetical protein [Actinomycetota bacterium]
MTEAAIAVGVAVQVVVWRLVARDRLPFWPATATTFAMIGITSLLAGDPSCCRESEVAVAFGVGVVSGLILYGATRVVVDVAAQHPSVRGAVASVYRRSMETTVFTTLALTLVIAVPGEELFWRGLVLPRAQRGDHLDHGRTPELGGRRRCERRVVQRALARRRGRGRRAVDGAGDVERGLAGAYREPSRLDRADARVAPSGGP